MANENTGTVEWRSGGHPRHEDGLRGRCMCTYCAWPETKIHGSDIAAAKRRGAMHCDGCGELCAVVGVCCSGGNNADGSYDEPVCVACCPVHAVSRAGARARVPFFCEAAS